MQYTFIDKQSLRTKVRNVIVSYAFWSPEFFTKVRYALPGTECNPLSLRINSSSLSLFQLEHAKYGKQCSVLFSLGSNHGLEVKSNLTWNFFIQRTRWLWKCRLLERVIPGWCSPVESLAEYDTLPRNAAFPARYNKEYYPRHRRRRGNSESVESCNSVPVGECRRVLECAVKYGTIRWDDWFLSKPYTEAPRMMLRQEISTDRFRRPAFDQNQ